MNRNEELHEGDIVDIITFDKKDYNNSKLIHIPHGPRELWVFEIEYGRVVFTEGPIIITK